MSGNREERNDTPAGTARGLQFSLRNILEHLLFERQIGDQLLQSAILVLELLEPLSLHNIETAVLSTPSITGLLGRAGFLAGCRHALTLSLQHLNLPELRHALLRS